MTGSAFTRWTLHVRAGGCNRGGSPREGSGGPILLETRLADFPFLWYSSARTLSFALHRWSQTGLRLAPGFFPGFFQVFPGLSWLFLAFSWPRLPLDTLLRAR